MDRSALGESELWQFFWDKQIYALLESVNKLIFQKVLKF